MSCWRKQVTFQHIADIISSFLTVKWENSLEVKAVFDKGDYSAIQSTDNDDLRHSETEETEAL